MTVRSLTIVAICVLACGVARAQDATPDPASNAEMAEIIAGDQGDRSVDPAQIDWPVVSARDAERRARTRELLDAGELTTADDFFYAAYVFQHGTTPDDYLLAHALAMAAQAKGRTDAAGIAAATLDRYLQNSGRSQIFGTQITSAGGGPPTLEPFDRTLVPDSVRVGMGGPTLQELESSVQALGGP